MCSLAYSVYRLHRSLLYAFSAVARAIQEANSSGEVDPQRQAEVSEAFPSCHISHDTLGHERSGN